MKSPLRAAGLRRASAALLVTAGMASRTAAAEENSQLRFALDLYRGVCREERGNVVLSPPSVATVLAMIAGGARGETAREVLQALRLPPDSTAEDAAALLRAARERLEGTDASGDALRSANSAWSHRDHPLRDEYERWVRERFDAAARSISMDREGVAAINAWVADQTQGLITKLFDELPPLTRLVLVNTIYFRGSWSTPFDPARTRPAPFQLGNEVVQVPAMHRTGSFGYARMPTFEALEIRYANPSLAFRVLLPEPGADAINRLEKELSVELLASLARSLEERQEEVSVQLPKFTAASRLMLNGPLRDDLGMVQAFSERADLSGMGGSPGDLYVDLLLQRAVIEVSEEGTEAAAATGAVMRATSMPPPPIPFVVDRPFLWMVVERSTGVPLFLGRVLDPR